MINKRGLWLAGLAVLAMAGTPRHCFGGTITFTGDAALVSALGTTMSTGVTQVGVGQTFSVPFSATVAGVESVSGTVVLTDSASGGSVQLSNVVFTSLSSTTSAVNFGLSVTQAFAASGPTTLVATETGNGTAHFASVSPPIQPGNAAVTSKDTFTPTIYPDNLSSSSGVIPFSFSVFAFPSDSFPENLTFSPLSEPITGIPKTTGNPVTLTFSYSTSISPFNTTMGAGTSTTLTSGGFGFVGAAVPEPTGLVLIGIGAVGIAAFSRRRGCRRGV
jgi:hypothetical protein